MTCPNCQSSYVHIGDDDKQECFSCTANWIGGYAPVGYIAKEVRLYSPLELLQRDCNDAGKEIRQKLYNWLYDCWDCRR